MFKTTDVMPEIYKRFPEIDEKELDKICSDGLKGLVKLIRDGEDVHVESLKLFPFIFYMPDTPKGAWERLSLRRIREKRRKKELLDGEKNK